MAKIGYLEQEISEAARHEYAGYIHSRYYQGKIFLIAESRKNSGPNAPAFVVKAPALGGFQPELGAAWWKVGRESGVEYMQIKLDVEGAPHGLWYRCLEATEGAGPRKFDVLYTAPRQGGQGDFAADEGAPE